MAKQVMDLMPSKGITTAQSNEHLRNFSQEAYRRKLTYAFDPSREHLNFEVGKGGVINPVDKTRSIPKRIRENLKERNIIDPNAGLDEPKYRTIANFILGGSRDQMHRLAFGDQQVNLDKGADNSAITRSPEIEKWAVDMYGFMSGKFGEKNIAAFIVHLDETNPHIHCTILPITEQDKFSWKMVMAGKSKFEFSQRMTKLHNELSEVNKKYSLERGDSIAETGRKHRSMGEYYAQKKEELKAEVDVLKEDVAEQKRQISRNMVTLSEQQKAIKHGEARLKGLTTMIANLERHKNDLLQEIDNLEKDVQAGRITRGQADVERAKILDEIEKTKIKIIDKKNKLEEAVKKLEKVKGQTEATEKRYEEIKYDIRSATPNLPIQALRDMQAVGWNLASVEAQKQHEKFNAYRASLPPEQRDAFDEATKGFSNGSMLEQMAENSSEVALVATALFLGYLDKATEISQNAGGSSAPQSGWGKKPDEDEMAFRQRCFLMGMHMLKGGKKRNVKR